MNVDEVRDGWDAEADAFDLEPDHGLLNPNTRQAWWVLLQALLPEPPARVADLGCGTGTVSALLAEHGYDVTGVDLSPRMIDLARTKAEASRQTVRFEVGNASEPPLDPGHFDVVFARHVVWALPDQAAVLQRWAALLAPAGRIVLIEGFWSTGAGLRADTLRALVEPVARNIDIIPLSDSTLWGKEIDDERYALLATL